jgi:hypothetical protein
MLQESACLYIIWHMYMVSVKKNFLDTYRQTHLWVSAYEELAIPW